MLFGSSVEVFPQCRSCRGKLRRDARRLEGDEEAKIWVKEAFGALGGWCFEIDATEKLLYHTGAIIVCNYMSALVEAGVRCLEGAGLPQEQAVRVLEPLMRETLDNVVSSGPAHALTGPIARGDTRTIINQLERLSAFDGDVREVYRWLGLIAVDLSLGKANANAGDLNLVEKILRAGQQLGDCVPGDEGR